MNRAIYAGSFDPITNGHLWMIKEGLKLFGRLIVAVGVNPSKTPLFTPQERIRMILSSVREACPTIGDYMDTADLQVDTFASKYLVDYAVDIEAEFILRGIRSVQDYEFERTMRYVNADLRPEVHTVFLMPPPELAVVSSSFVKGLIGPEGWEDVVKKYVPESVFQALKAKNQS